MSLPQLLPTAEASPPPDSSSVPSEPHPPAGGFSLAVIALGLGIVVLLGFLFAGCFAELSVYWRVDDTYSHGFLVPVISAYLAWEVLRRQGLPAQGSASGLLWIAIGCLFRLWAEVTAWPPVDFVALSTMLYGLAVLAGGRSWAMGFAFPIIFLAFMFPLPPAIIDWAAVQLQGMVTSAATFTLQLFLPAYREGNVIHLASRQLTVGEACSGLRQILAFFALALLVAAHSPRRLLLRSALVISALPIAIAANLLRVLLMAFLTVQFGPDSISEEKTLIFGISYHTAWGLLTMVAGLVLFLGVRAWLLRLFPGGSARLEDRGSNCAICDPQPSILNPRLLLLAAGFLAVTLLLQLPLMAHLRAADEAAATTLTRPLSGFPVSLGAWTGKDVSPDPAALPTFNAADDRLNRVYTSESPSIPRGLECRVWMIHYKDGSDRRHHPRTCSEVIGLVEDPSGNADLDLPGHSSPVKRFCFTGKGGRSYVYYWHYTLQAAAGEEAPSLLQRIHQEFGARRPSLTVEVFTNGHAPEHLEKVADFVAHVDRQLQGYLPPNSRRGSETLPIRRVGVPRPGTR